MTAEAVASDLNTIATRSSTETASASHQVYIGRVEIGACWSKRSNEGRDYLSAELDDGRGHRQQMRGCDVVAVRVDDVAPASSPPDQTHQWPSYADGRA
jgi:hypothetical protein